MDNSGKTTPPFSNKDTSLVLNEISTERIIQDESTNINQKEEVVNLAENVNNLNISSKSGKDKIHVGDNEQSKKDNSSVGLALRNYLQVYDSSESEQEDEIEFVKSEMRNNKDTSPSDDDEDAEDSSEDSDSDIDEIVVEKHTGAVRKSKDLHKKSNTEELPPVPDISSLNIHAEKLEFINIGKILNIVQTLVTVETKPNLPAYDIDTILFLDDKGTPLGFIDDVIGTVSNPMYVVRFNTVKQIESMKLKPGQDVYSAPKSAHTKYVFLQQLLKLKGTDASWVGDNEVPVEFQDFSDDEAESSHKHGKHSLIGKKRPHSSLERYKRYERTMNIENRIDTCLHKAQDTFTKRTPSITATDPVLMNHISEPLLQSPAAPFNPLVPPPSMISQSARPTVIVAPTVIGRNLLSHSPFRLPNMQPQLLASSPNMPLSFANLGTPPPNLNAPPPVMQCPPNANPLPFGPRFIPPYSYNATCVPPLRPFTDTGFINLRNHPRNGEEGIAHVGPIASQVYWQTEAFYEHSPHGPQPYPFRYAGPTVAMTIPGQLNPRPLGPTFYGSVTHSRGSTHFSQDNSLPLSPPGVSQVNESRQQRSTVRSNQESWPPRDHNRVH